MSSALSNHTLNTTEQSTLIGENSGGTAILADGLEAPVSEVVPPQPNNRSAANRLPNYLPNRQHVERFLSYFYDPEHAEPLPGRYANCPIVQENRYILASENGIQLVRPDQYPAPHSGWFDNRKDFRRQLDRVRGVSSYITANPTIEDLLSRANNRVIKVGTGQATSAKQILCLRNLLLDVDPVKAAGSADFSATDEEVAPVITAWQKFLANHPEIVRCMIHGFSGSGQWGLLRLPDYDNDEQHKHLCHQFLLWLDRHYSTETAKFDRKVVDPSRIMGIAGMWKCKGDHTSKRPHRLATIDTPDGFQRKKFDLIGWLEEHDDGQIQWDHDKEEATPATDSVNPPATQRRVGVCSDASPRSPQRQASKGNAHRIRPYVAKLDPSIQGQDGEPNCIGILCRLFNRFDLTENQAFDYLWPDWNPRCVPPFSEQQLRRKVKEAFKKTRGERNGDYLLNEATHKGGRRPDHAITAETNPSSGNEPTLPPFSNYHLEPESTDDGKTKLKKIPHTAPQIVAHLEALATGQLKRLGNQQNGYRLFIETENHTPRFLTTATDLFAFINGFAHVDWEKGPKCISMEVFHTFLSHCDTLPCFESIETLPHVPPFENAYYLQTPMREAGEESNRLLELLDRFSPATPVDRSLILALICTPLWGGELGGRPAFLVTGQSGTGDNRQGRGLGKSTLIDLIATHLYGGYVNVMPNDDFGKVLTRMLSAAGKRKRIARLDNVKSHKFSWSDLEGMITSPSISGHEMYRGEADRRNDFVWFVTLNGASLSADLAERVITVHLKRSLSKSQWKNSTIAFMQEHRWEILAEIARLLQEPSAELPTVTRWATWEEEVLLKIPDAEACQRVILERQGEINEGSADRDLARIAVIQAVESVHGRHQADSTSVRIASSVMAQIIKHGLMKNFADTGSYTSFVKGLEIPELTYHHSKNFRGFFWCGEKAIDPKPDDELNYTPYR